MTHLDRPFVPTVVEIPAEIPILVGPREIGKFLNRDPRETDRLIRLGVIPTWKFGSQRVL